jgi:hypothetical protein
VIEPTLRVSMHFIAELDMELLYTFDGDLVVLRGIRPRRYL